MFKLNQKKPFIKGRHRRWLCAIAVSALLAGCTESTDNPDTDATGNGGIIGTGIRLEGTASSQRLFAKNDIEIKSQSGEKSMATIGNRGRFQLAELNGTGPYLMRAATGENEYLYSIGYPQTAESLAQNIHSYTDAAARNWFATQGLDIDAAFMGSTPIDQLPTQAALRAISNRLHAIVNNVLTEYNLGNTDLDTVSFSADDTGVDLFLDSNPVVINNGTINIYILDQDTNVSTPSSTNVLINTDLAQEDTLAPSVPDSLRALAASLNEIVVVWNASTDNIGVAAYQVFRDGVLVATTPFPVFTDTGLTANTQYSYTVVAIDSSGNMSADSIMAMSETLAAPDTLAPPAPLAVMLEASEGSFSVNWSQQDIADVKAFNVYRSGTGVGAEATFKVTSTFLTDVSVVSGGEYCYEVSAEDASENESARSPIACASTSGQTVTPGPDEVTPPVVTPPVTAGELVAPTLDVTAMACTQELPNGGKIESDSVLAAGCYLAPTGLRVFEPANLTMQPGVVIKFAASRDLQIDSGASLTAVGTAVAPIVFSAIDPTPGFWTGVKYRFSNSTRNQLDFVLVEYAGNSDKGANIQTIANSGNAARVSIKNTTTRNSLGYGILFDNHSIIEAFEGNLLTGNNAPLLLTPDAAHGISASSRYSGNTNDRVELIEIDVEATTRLAKLDVPYLSSGITVDNSLTVEPGVEIFFSSDARLYVTKEATLKAVGSAAEPILFTATDPTPGFWDGIEFFYSSGASELAHVTVEYGGAGSNGANLVMKSFDSNTSRLAANNLTLRHSLNDGFRIESGAALTQFDQITSTQNGRSGSVAVNVVGKMGPGASFTGNTDDAVTVFDGTLKTDATWLTHDVPYSVGDLSLDAGLTLSPGTTFLMQAGGRVYVKKDGALTAVGTALDNIVFTGQVSTPGHWDGIEFFYSPSTANRLSHVVVEHGGAGVGDTTKAGNIVMKCFASTPSRLSIDNAQLNFGLGWGMYAEQAGCEVTLGMNVTYTSNIQGGFNLMP